MRSRRIPYVAVDEAKRALLPEGAHLHLTCPADGPDAPAAQCALKSFDFVIYGDHGSGNLLIDIKGRKVGTSRRTGQLGSRLESWVTLDDIESLRRWQALFGPGFEPAFVFIYWCDAQPPDALFQEVVEYRGVWYALRAVTLETYRQHMKVRSPRWGTVDLPNAVFERVSQPFAPPPRAHDNDLLSVTIPTLASFAR